MVSKNPEHIMPFSHNDFEVLEQVGEGYHSRILRVNYLGDERILKIYKDDGGAWNTRMHNEYRQLHKINNVLSLSTVPKVRNWDEKIRGIIMDYYPGTQWADSYGRHINVDKWFTLTKTVMDCHKLHIYHCDVNPYNILFWNKGSILLFDWALSAEGEIIDRNRFGKVRGEWWPEEQMKGYIKPSLDIYGLSAVLLWMLTGLKPYNKPLDGYSRQRRATIEEHLMTNYHNPRELAGILEKGTATHEDDRYKEVLLLYNDVYNWFNI